MTTSPELILLKQKLVSQRAQLWEAVQRLEAAQPTSTVQGGWSVKELLAHLATAEAINVKFARLMLSHDHPVQLSVMARDYPDYVGPFSLDDFNAYMTQKLRDKSAEEVLQNLQATRAETMAWIETLTPEQLERGGQHAAWGDQTVRGMLKILLLHEKSHLRDILKSKVEGG